MVADKLLVSLYRANQGVLAHKLGLVETLVSKFGQVEAQQLFQRRCDVVNATVGQHFRHSTDHMERAVLAALDYQQSEIHYDVRQRGKLDEYDLNAAAKRVRRVQNLFDQIGSFTPSMHHPTQAYFMLSGDDASELALPTTVARELAFGAHHAIHHLALVRIICFHTLGMDMDDLPPDFGRAPSTLNFDAGRSS